MDRIQELLERLSDLSDEELTELNGLLAEAYTAIDSSDEPATAEQISQMNTLVEGLETVAAENTRRTELATQREQQRAELKTRADALLNPPEEGETPPEDAPTDEAPAEDEELDEDGKPKKKVTAETPPAADETPTEAPADSPLIPVNASTEPPRGDPAAGDGMVERMAAVGGPAKPSPTQNQTETFGTTLVAAGGLRGIGINTPFEDRLQLGQVMADQIDALGQPHGEYHHPALIATARWEYPEDRRLTGDANANSEKFNAICAIEAQRVDPKDTTALVATGGVCLPVNVDYAVPTWSTADRPLRDGLPAFQADRGGLRYVTPPDIGVPPLQGTASGAGLSTNTWTEATDANPAGATKPVWEVTCGTENLVYVNAITTRVQFGNMQSRFAPEQVAANTQQAIAVSARQAELELLTLMLSVSFCKEVSIGTQYLGALRDVLSAVDLLKSQYCDSHRIPESASFTAIFPQWAKNMFKADLLRETAHDNAGPRDVLAVTDAQIEALFSVRGVNVIWTLEGVKSGTYGNVTVGTSQQFSVFTTGNTPQWPGQASSAAFELLWLLYVEGTYQFLDSGRLDLGVVRDSILDSTNDYETFVETFEGVAGRGIDAYGVVQTLLPSGGSAGTVAVGSYKE
ncbi:MAG TPA: major capsid protein [Acidimicrobiales bacterium]|nr:major capsid protein [Acidimicrobiales bacterium]